MSISTTRSLADLRAECTKQGIVWSRTDGKEQLVNRLRDKLSGGAPQLHDPMKCKDLKKDIAWGTDDPFAGIGVYLRPDKYGMEPKYDGCRMTLVLGPQRNKVYSGRRSVKTYAASDRTDNFPHLRDAVLLKGQGATVVDGELLAPSSRIQTHTGNWTDSLLNASVALCNSNPAASAATQAKFGKARFVAFDVTSVMGEDVTGLPYRERRRLLEQVVEGLVKINPDCKVEIAPLVPASEESIRKAIADGYEGVVIKRWDAPYKAGSRSGGWYKVKTMSTADGFVTGFTPGESGNTGLVGSLELSVVERELAPGESAKTDLTYMHPTTGKLYEARPVAQVGNLTEVMRKAITTPAGTLEENFYGTVIEFMGQGVGKNGKVRHPHMLRLRPDKGALDCQPDQLDVFPKV